MWGRRGRDSYGLSHWMGKPPGTLSPQRNAGRGCCWAGKGLPEALLQIWPPKAKPPHFFPSEGKWGYEVATALLEDDFFYSLFKYVFWVGTFLDL